MADSARVDRVFRRVHERASRTIAELAEPLLEALEKLQLGPSGSRREFRPALQSAVQSLLFRPMNEAPYAAMTLRTPREKRQAALEEFFTGLGVPEGTAGNYARSLSAAREHYGDNGQREALSESNWRTNRNWQGLMNPWLSLIYNRGRRVYRQLEEIKRDANAPYEGSARDPEDGVEQTVELLRRFPAIADYVYRNTGLEGLESFPPEPKGAPGSDAHLFATEVQAHLDREWWSDTIFAAGLAVLAVAVTVASMGTLGPFAAAALGSGLGLAQGGMLVMERSAAVSEGRIAVRMGAMDANTLRQLEGSLEGAWGMMLVDMATGGVLARFGGTRVLSQVVRGTVISSAGGGLSTAVDPNVWADEDRVGLVLQGALIGGAVGFVGAGAGAGFTRLSQGGPVQIGVVRETGRLSAGDKVSVGFARDAEPVSGTVTRIEGNTMHVSVQGQDVAVRVERTIELRANAANANRAPLPPAPDSAPRPMGYVLDESSGQVVATTRARVPNDAMIRARPHGEGGAGLSGYPGLQRATTSLEGPHRVVEIDGQTAVQVLKPANGTVHPQDVVQHGGQDYFVSHVLRPQEGGGGVEVMPVSSRRNRTGVRGAQFTPTPPGTADTHTLMRRIQSSAGPAGPLLRRNVVHQRDMGSLSGFAEHVVRERVVPNNLVSGANPTYQRAVLDQYDDGATFIFVSHWESGRFFSWPSGSGTTRADGRAHVRSTVGSQRAHLSAARDMGRLSGIGGRLPGTTSATPGSAQANYNDFVGGTFQFHNGHIYWNDKSNSINELISDVGRSDGHFYDDMHPVMTRRLQEWFGLSADRIHYVGSSRDFPVNSRPGY